MTNWNRIKEIDRINQRELDLNIGSSGSWHNRYCHSAYIYVGNIHFDLNEGDLITVFSQFGEIVDCNLIRDKETGDPKGFAFIAFENQKSTNLAVDNMNGAILLKRTLNVDHVNRYRKPKHFKDRENKMKDNQYGDVDEDDETYDQRRKKIWDYEKYYGLNTDNMDIINTKQKNAKFDQKEVDKINKQYLNEKKNKEDKFEKKKSNLDKKIEIRKLKRKLLRMKRNENNHNDKNKRFERKDKYNKNTEDDDKWIDNGSELRDKFGRIIDIEKELEKRKKLEELEKREEYEAELREIKEEKKKKEKIKKVKESIIKFKVKEIE